MLKWALLFVVLAVASGFLGFTTVSGQAYLIARIMVLPCLAAVLVFLALRFGTAQPNR